MYWVPRIVAGGSFVVALLVTLRGEWRRTWSVADSLLYAMNYADGHASTGLWDQGRASAFVAESWRVSLPVFASFVVGPVLLTLVSAWLFCWAVTCLVAQQQASER
jgi:hypothetical protein